MARLTEIADHIATLIAAIPDWGSVNEPNVSQMRYPSANIVYKRETPVDQDGPLGFYGYCDAEMVITVRCETSTVADFPPHTIDALFDTWLNNLRNTLGYDNGVLALNHYPVIRYRGFERFPEPHGDAFVPSRMETYWTVRYQYKETYYTTSSSSASSQSSSSSSTEASTSSSSQSSSSQSNSSSSTSSEGDD
jgi:hypothetical protein